MREKRPDLRAVGNGEPAANDEEWAEGEWVIFDFVFKAAIENKVNGGDAGHKKCERQRKDAAPCANGGEEFDVAPAECWAAEGAGHGYF